MKIIGETDRVYLRETSVVDAEFFFDLNNDPEVIKFTGDGAFESVEAARDFLSRYDQFEKYQMGRWAVVSKENEEVLGWCGLKFHPKEDFVDLGFRLFQNQWGKGYATEASKLSLEYGFRTLGLEHVIGRADVRNQASIRVLEKMGMVEKERGIDHGAEIVVMEVDKYGYSFIE